MDREYMFHCAGCKKPDKEFPNKETVCDECQGEDVGAYVNDDGNCWKCNGYGEYIDRVKVSEHMWARVDAYGIYTGLYCDKCYDDKEKYTYRKDRYHDEAYCGEKLEEDY